MARLNRPATFTEACRVTGIGPLAMRKALRSGDIRGAKFGKNWVIPWTSLDEIVGRELQADDVCEPRKVTWTRERASRERPDTQD